MVLTKQKMTTLIEEQRQKQLAILSGRFAKTKYSLHFEKEQVAQILRKIPAQLDYTEWRNIVWATIGYCGIGTGMELIEAWSPDEKTKGKHLRQLALRCDGRIGFGYVLRMAVKHGYQLPLDLRKSRMPGQVALEDVFSGGNNHVAIATDLYEWVGNHHQKLSKEYCLKLIADYFHEYVTEKSGRTAFATQNKIMEAFQYVVSKLYVDPEKVNPPGINTRNGYLQLSFKNRKAIWTLIPHTPDIIHTYVGDFDYNLEADTELVSSILSDILDPPQLKVFLRTVAASFALPMIRKLQGRSVRVLILLGEGSNGKDTLRVWVELLLGEFGLTSVSLRDFVKADSAARFGLYPLATSIVNWASENDVVALDKCQTLKNFATGDPIVIERKHKDATTIHPKAIGLFNANEAPHVSTTMEAIKSRYAFIDFPNKFVRSPRPGHPREKQGDPKLKEDTAFIKAHILPGFLNLLMSALNDLIAEGIDFECTEETIENVKKDSNHFYQFIQETELVPCPIEEGESPLNIFLRYQFWCADNQLMKRVFNLEYGTETGQAWQHPSKYDRCVTNVREITRRLRNEFPDLVIDRNNKGRKVGLKFLTKTDY